MSFFRTVLAVEPWSENFCALTLTSSTFCRPSPQNNLFHINHTVWFRFGRSLVVRLTHLLIASIRLIVQIIKSGDWEKILSYAKRTNPIAKTLLVKDDKTFSLRFSFYFGLCLCFYLKKITSYYFKQVFLWRLVSIKSTFLRHTRMWKLF